MTNTRQFFAPGVLRDGSAFFVGGTGHTALYASPANPTQPSAWAACPDLPADTSANDFNNANGSIQTAIDAPAVLLPNGKVLCVGGQAVREVDNGIVSFWSNPSTVFLFDPSANAIAQLNPHPPSNNVDCWQSRFQQGKHELAARYWKHQVAAAANLWFKSQPDTIIGCSTNSEFPNLFTITYNDYRTIKAENSET